MRALVSASIFLAIVLAPVSSVDAVVPAGVVALNFLKDYALGKLLDVAFDAATGKADPDELQRQLVNLETALRRMGNQQDDLLSEISDLRRTVDERTSRESVERIIRSVLSSYEDRLSKIESRLTTAEQHISDIESLFGYVPTVAPAPLLADAAEAGEPAVHPLMREWAKLLVRSEVNRLEIARLRQIYQDNAPELNTAFRDAQAILTGISSLHARMKAEMAARLPEREQLLITLRSTHPRVRELDAQLGSIAWLLGITRPIEQGPDKGRLPVPRDFMGPRCSDILAAYDLSGVDEAEMVPLFRALIPLPVQGARTGGDVPMPRTLQTHMAGTESLLGDLGTLADDASQVKAKLTAALQAYSSAHPEVVALRKRRAALLSQAADLHQRAETLLTEALTAYIREARQLRPNSGPMLDFRARVLQPLLEKCSLFAGAGGSLRTQQEEAWENLAKGSGTLRLIRGVYTNFLGMRFVPVVDQSDGSKVFFSVFETRRQDYAAYAEKNDGVDDSWKDPEYVAVGGTIDQEDNHPVVSVSLEDAAAFCAWLTRVDRAAGRIGPKDVYRLPKDLEWSYAVGIGDEERRNVSESKLKDIYPWGGKFPPTGRVGNYVDETWKATFVTFGSPIEGYTDGYATTAPVGSFPANSKGLYDLGGNVYELCEDGYTVKGRVVLRGGSWDFSGLGTLGSSHREDYQRKKHDVGFRCVLVVDSPRFN